MYKGVMREIKKIQKWVDKETDGANIEDFLEDAAEIYQDTLEDPSVDSINDCLWFEADKFVDVWKEDHAK